MKLRNRRTGEIRDTEKWVFSVTDKGILFGDTAYNSLAELCEEWEDYKEPKGYWYINSLGDICWSTYIEEEANIRKLIGNYFETEEEAEKAVEKLKALTRLEDKGLHFLGWDKNYGIQFTLDFSQDVNKDLDLLFGGEE